MAKYPPLPETFVSRFFLQHCEGAHKGANGVYNGGCPICREGKSWGQKRRSFYFPETDWVMCHNCGFSAKSIAWIAEVCNISFKEVAALLREENSNIDSLFITKKAPVKTQEKEVKKKLELPCVLPYDAIDIIDDGENVHRVVEEGKKGIIEAVAYANSRGLYDCVNPGPLYYSGQDMFHNNRLIIPFYNTSNKLEFFQSRAYREKDADRRYISSYGSTKNCYGIERVSFEKKHLFIQEGPLNCFFLRNSVAVGGITLSETKIFTDKQRKELGVFPRDRTIWVLDNPAMDNTANTKADFLRKMGFKVFTWPDKYEFSESKDLNEYCLKQKIPGVPGDLIVENCL